MKKFLKWFGIVLGSLLGLILVAFIALSVTGSIRLSRTYDIPDAPVTIPTNADSIARGKHWVDAICIGCHLPTLEGQIMVEAPFATIYSANLTSGKGGVGATFSDADWVRALRHGVDDEGKPVIVMPSQYFWHFSDEDLADIIAYLKTAPPIDNEHPNPTFNPLGKAMLAAGVFGPAILPAEVIQHDQRPASYPPTAVNAQYGEYLVNVSGCHDCHGPQLSGGKGADPNAIAAPNLTPGGELRAWQEVDFVTAIRTGVAKSGHQLDPAQMPWEHYKNYNDDELGAIWQYLQSLPALETTLP